MTSFREARVDEDDTLSRILCNAFLPVWNHNWFHSATSPLEPVPTAVTSSTPQLTHLQSTRVAFYLAIIKLTRLNNGSVLVATVPPSSTQPDPVPDSTIGAILLWVPPHQPPSTLRSILDLYNSGLLSFLLPWHYGLTGLYRISFVFEANVSAMSAQTLHPLGYQPSTCGHIQMIASHPAHAGRGYASALLAWQLARHFATCPAAPVILDTSTAQAQRAYERLGFRVLARRSVETDTDASGVRFAAVGVSEEERREAREVCVQRLMVRMP